MPAVTLRPLCRVTCTVNGESRTLDIPTTATLLDILRDDLGLTGTKSCCLVGECGACTVDLDGRIVDACLVLAAEVDGSTVTTIEGVAPDGALTALQEAFLDHGAVQCGYCIPGQVMAARDLLGRVANPTHADVREAIAGNLCRCGGYDLIAEAILATADAAGAQVR